MSGRPIPSDLHNQIPQDDRIAPSGDGAYDVNRDITAIAEPNAEALFPCARLERVSSPESSGNQTARLQTGRWPGEHVHTQVFDSQVDDLESSSAVESL